MQVSVSIHDFSPLFRDLEYVFAGLKQSGADGLELLVGVKSRWRVETIRRLSLQYDLPITTLHQPIWSGMGWWLDEEFVRLGAQLGAKYIALHPREGTDMLSSQMEHYLSQFAKWQRQYGITFCLENMPAKIVHPVFEKLITIVPNQADLSLVAATAQRHGLYLTYDTSHTMYSRPQEHDDFLAYFPSVRNIHLSSFSPTVEHLPLDQGDLDTVSFVKFLEDKKYPGIVTLEIFYPDLFTAWGYDFGAIQRSIELVKSVV